MTRQAIGPPLTQKTSHLIWQNGFICQDASSQVRVILADDSRSILVHVRGTETAADTRRLLLKFIRTMDQTSRLSTGLALDVNVLSNADLVSYSTTPTAIPLSKLIHARSLGATAVSVSDASSELVRDLIALEDDSSKMHLLLRP